MFACTDSHRLKPDAFPRRKRSDDDDFPGNSDAPIPKRARTSNAVNEFTIPRETYIIGDDDDDPVTTMRGAGTTEDPIQFREWTADNIITVVDEEVISLLSDNEDEEGLISLLSDDEDNEVSTSIVRRSVESEGVRSPALSLSSNAFDQISSPRSDISSEDAQFMLLGSTSDVRDASVASLLSSTTIGSFRHASTDNSDIESEQFFTPFGTSPTPADHSDNSPTPVDHSDNNPDLSRCAVIDVDLDEDEEDEEAFDRISRQIPLWNDWFHSREIKAEPEDTDEGFSFEEPQHVQPIEPARNGASPIIREQSLSPSNPPSPTSSPLDPPDSQGVQEETPIDTEETRQQAIPKGKALTIEKKRFFYTRYASAHLPELRARLSSQIERHVQMPSTHHKDSCHIWTGPVPGNNNLAFIFTFTHASIRYRLQLNLNTVNLLVHNRLSARDIDGLVYDWWHASHLCGNWRCVNVNHVIAEPGPVNVTRNRCLRANPGATVKCSHVPRCLVEFTAPIAEEDRAGGKARRIKSFVGAGDEGAQVDGGGVNINTS